jgi:two-component sensor histidine kinase
VPPLTPADGVALREGVRAGTALGWTSLAAVAVALLVGVPVRDAGLVAALAAAAAVGHAVMARLPWARLLPTPRGRLLVDVWAGGVLVAVCALVLVAGGRSRLDLLLLLVVPFLAILHDDDPRRLAAWMAAAAAAFAAVVGLARDPLPTGEALLHLVLLAGATLLGLTLARALRRQAAAQVEATRRAELEGAMLAEAHHRVKNSLQVVADLLLLGRPDDPAGAAALDRAAERIRSIAAVHQVLARRGGGRVPAPELLGAVVAAAPDGVATVASDPVDLPFAQAQHVGVIVNELVTNAQQHGTPPVRVELRAGPPVQLVVADAGGGPPDAAFTGPGLGLPLVRQVAATGLGGTLVRDPDGAIRLTFDLTAADARPRR